MRTLRWVTAVLLGALLLLQWPLWLGERGWPAVRRLQAALQTQLQANQQAAQANDALQAEARDLRTGMQAVQDRARREMGMVAQGEIFVQVLPASSPLPPRAPASAPRPASRR